MNSEFNFRGSICSGKRVLVVRKFLLACGMTALNSVVFTFLIIMITNQVSGQNRPDTGIVDVKTRFEIGFTPRLAGIIDHKVSPSDSGFCYSTMWHRIQAGAEIVKNQYVHFFLDYYRVRTDLKYPEPAIDALGIGIQYSSKFKNAIVCLPPIRLYRKPIYIQWYPELSVSMGFMNLSNDTFRLSGLSQSKAYHLYVQYGIAWNFYLNKWSNISILYFHEYLTNVSSDVHRYHPLQTKFVIKL